MARIPDKEEHQSRLMQLDFKERRAIVRAVNRGQAVDKKAHAVLAVGVARRQQRFWKVAWLLGPVLGGVQLLFADVESALTNAVIGTVALGMMSAFWLWRARRSEQRNLDLLEGRRSRPSSRRPSPDADDRPTNWTDRFRRSRSTPEASADTPPPARPRGHLPGDRPARPTTSRDRATNDDARGPAGAGPAGPKPPQPRGKKRRR